MTREGGDPLLGNRVGRFPFLLIALLFYTLIEPALQVFGHIHVLAAIFLTAILLSGVYAVSGERLRVLITGICLAVPAFFLTWLRPYHKPDEPSILIDIFFILFLGYAAIVILRHLLAMEKVTAEVIIGAVCVYFLLGLMWANAYSLVEGLQPGSFSSIASDPAGNFKYFSFVTLTTLGYGDIAPLSQVARSLVLLEAITGQLYLAVLIARMVGIHISQGAPGRRSGK